MDSWSLQGGLSRLERRAYSLTMAAQPDFVISKFSGKTGVKADGRVHYV